MNANVKIIRYKSKEQKSGKAPLAIRITKFGERSYIFLKHFLTFDEWDEEGSTVRKNYPNSRRLNISLNEKASEAEKVILDAENNNVDLSAAQIKELIQAGGFSFISFNRLAKEYLDEKSKANKFNQLIADKGKFKAFRTFLEGERLGIASKIEPNEVKGRDEEETKKKKEEAPKIDFNVKNITGVLLKDYKNHLESLGQKKASIYNKLNIIRIIYNKAIAKRLIDRNNYPFGKGVGQIQIRPGEGMQVGMEENELDLFEVVDLSESNPDVIIELTKDVKYVKNKTQRIEDLIHARNVFMFSYYFAGVRIADVLKTKWNDFKNGRYYYFIGKNSRPTDVPIPDQVLSILAYYEKDKESTDDYVFPELKKANQKDSKDIFNKARSANKKINEDLAIVARIAKLDKKPAIHNSRHTFGDHAKGNIAPEILQQLYRHSHLSTTINYQKRWVKKDQLDQGFMQVVNSRKKKEDIIPVNI